MQFQNFTHSVVRFDTYSARAIEAHTSIGKLNHGSHLATAGSFTIRPFGRLPWFL